jgi:hypothetical protein
LLLLLLLPLLLLLLLLLPLLLLLLLLPLLLLLLLLPLLLLLLLLLPPYLLPRQLTFAPALPAPLFCASPALQGAAQRRLPCACCRA